MATASDPIPESIHDDRPGWRTVLGYLIPGLGIAAAALATRLDFPSYADEVYYYPMAREFARGITIELLRDYAGIPCSIGPAMHAVYGAWMHVAGESLLAARVLSVLLTAVAGAVVVDIGRLSGVKHPAWFGFGVLALPHFASSGITQQSEGWTLLGAALAVDFWLRGLRSGREAWFWASAVPLAASINTRPTQLPLALGLGAIGLLTRGIRLSSVIAPALAVAVQLPLWRMWGGPYNPTQVRGVITGVETKAGINVATLVHLVSVVGLVLWPALLAARHRTPRSPWFWAAVAVAAGAVFVAFQPDLAPRFSGPLAVAGRARGGLFKPLLALPYLAGALLSAWAAWLALDRRAGAVDRTLAAVAVTGTLIYVLSPLAYERYVLMATPFWLALAVPRIEEATAAWVTWRGWIGALMVASALAIVAIDRGRPVGQWDVTSGNPPAGAVGRPAVAP